MARQGKTCVQCGSGFQVNTASSTATRLVCVPCEKASKPKRVIKPNPAAKSYSCVDCGAPSPGGRAWKVRCPGCRVKHEKERLRQRAKPCKPAISVACEGCGQAEVQLVRNKTVPFCPTCRAFNENWYKKQRCKHVPKFIVDYDRSIARPSIDKKRSVQSDVHVKDYRCHLTVAQKPWRARGLSDAEQYRIRYATDPEFALLQRTKTSLRRKGIGFTASHRLRRALAGKGDERSETRFVATLGYTSADLKLHLERQFTDGMDWGVFHTGAIHIDHIRPLNTFNLHEPGVARVAWALSNLRPLWAVDNLSRPKDGRDVAWPAVADNDNEPSHALAA